MAIRNQSLGKEILTWMPIMMLLKNYSLMRVNRFFQGNVIHLLESPYDTLNELLRVCKKGGKVIIPTYINKSNASSSIAAKVLDIFGANFKRQFDLESYKKFFNDGGFDDVEYFVVDGRMPCAVAVIKKL